MNNTIENLEKINFPEKTSLYNLENNLYDRFIDCVLEIYRNKQENIKEPSSKKSLNLKKNISDVESKISKIQKCKNVQDKKIEF